MPGQGTRLARAIVALDEVSHGRILSALRRTGVTVVAAPTRPEELGNGGAPEIVIVGPAGYAPAQRSG